MVQNWNLLTKQIFWYFQFLIFLKGWESHFKQQRVTVFEENSSMDKVFLFLKNYKLLNAVQPICKRLALSLIQKTRLIYLQRLAVTPFTLQWFVLFVVSSAFANSPPSSLFLSFATSIFQYAVFLLIYRTVAAKYMWTWWNGCSTAADLSRALTCHRSQGRKINKTLSSQN